MKRREISLGRTNDKFVQIVSGLAEGDRVILNPMAVADGFPSDDEERPGEPDLDELSDPDSDELVATSSAS